MPFVESRRSLRAHVVFKGRALPWLAEKRESVCVSLFLISKASGQKAYDPRMQRYFQSFATSYESSDAP